MGADCVIFFQEIESNLRSMEVQFGMDKRSLKGTAEISVKAMYAYLVSNAAVSHCQVELA